jgi:type III pantothenate kinase
MNILLFDIGNTHTHIGVGNSKRVLKRADTPTAGWRDGSIEKKILQFVGRTKIDGASLCSVVPKATPHAHRLVKRVLRVPCLELTAKTTRGVGIDYPKPATIGADRLANAIAARHHYGVPVVVVDFGTAVTFDIVNQKGDYTGGIIAPGLALMTRYLHEKTALLPFIKIREIKTVIGKNTKQAMLVGAVHGYRGMVRGLILELKRQLSARRLPVVATGGYAHLMAAGVSEITAEDGALTLEGLRLLWQFHRHDDH